MLDRLLALSGPHAWLAWVSLFSAAIGIASVVMQAAVKAPVRLGSSLMFRFAFIALFCRITYRQVHPDAQLTYGAVAIYALPGLACVWAVWDALRHRNEGVM